MDLIGGGRQKLEWRAAIYCRLAESSNGENCLVITPLAVGDAGVPRGLCVDPRAGQFAYVL